MGQNQIDNSIEGDLSCKKCHSHYLFELISNENNILLRKYCFCGESTIAVDHDLKLKIMEGFNFYKDYKCDCIPLLMGNNNERKNISKYCYTCEKFLCNDCLQNHVHQNMISPDFLLTNCKYHINQKLVGFCKKCKKPLCEKCIDESHKNHEIKYTKDLEITNEIVEKYKNNLLKAFLECDRLMKLKYGKETKVYLSNLSHPQTLTFFDPIDKQIIMTLELLKTILDLYNYHKNNNSLNYQLISNLLKHINVEIIRLKNKEDIVIQNQGNNNRFASITNTVIDDPDKPNKNINIYLKIDLENEESREKQINIELVKILNKDIKLKGKKLIKLINGDLASCYQRHKKIIFFKNLQEDDNCLEAEDEIIDFIQLENGNLIILLKNKVVIYNNESNLFNKDIEINLDTNKDYYKIHNISNNNFSLLSISKNEDKTFMACLTCPNYDLEEMELIDQKSENGDLIHIKNLIIVGLDLKTLSKIFFYDMDNKKLENIEIKNNENNYDKKINIFKINNEKILVSSLSYGFIISIKEKQIVSSIIKFKNICSMAKIGKYMLAGIKNGKLLQINLKIGEIFNEFIPKFNNKNNFNDIIDIIDVGNSQFCTISKNDGVYLFKYN